MSLCCCPSSDDDDTINFFDLSHGTEIPVKKRKQTDLPSLIVLVAFFSFMVICVSIAGSQGDIRRFVYGYDSKGNLCGFKNEPIKGIQGSGLDLTKKKFLNIAKHCEEYFSNCVIEKECVETCESGYEHWITQTCNLDSNDLLGASRSFLKYIYSDLSLCWREIIILCFGSICLSGLMMIALRTFAKLVVRILIIVSCIGAVVWTVFTWIMFAVKVVKKSNAAFKLQASMEGEMYGWLCISIIFTIFTLVILIAMYKTRKNLPLLAALFEEGGKCIKDIPMMLLQPVLTYVISFIFTCFFVVGLICFQTSGKAELDIDGNVYFPVNIFFQIASWLLLFAYLWLTQFFLACQNFVIAGAVSSWYFSRVKGKLTDPVWQSIGTLVKHHLGSAAFGSLLIAIIKLIRLIVRMLESRSRNNLVGVIIWCVVRCILACIESILRILNKSAYVMIVLLGEPFCKSARRAYACLTSDSSKVALIIGVQTFLLSVAEFVIITTVTLIGIVIFMNIQGLQTFWIPVLVLFLLSYLCCHCLFSVYEMTIDTLILCFCVDHQTNDGLEKPYYMNQNLTIFLQGDVPNVNTNTGGDHKLFTVT